MKNNQDQTVLKFEDMRPRIIAALKDHSKNSGIKEEVSLVDGFVSQPFSLELSNSVILGGPMVPLIMLVGNESGQIYFFALKAILKDLDI
jgi:hypothetical protein